MFDFVDIFSDSLVNSIDFRGGIDLDVEHLPGQVFFAGGAGVFLFAKMVKRLPKSHGRLDGKIIFELVGQIDSGINIHPMVPGAVFAVKVSVLGSKVEIKARF